MLPAWFDTSSNAEHHWKPLHKLIVKYHSIVYNRDETQVWEEFTANSAFKHQLLADNSHIVTNYFHARDINYKNTVLKEVYDWVDVWLRDEFAKSRGQIHDHALIYSKNHYEKVKAIMSSDLDTNGKAILLHQWLQTNQHDTDSFHSPNIVSLHPAGGYFDENDKWIPDKHKWAKPEGLSDLNSDVLKKSLLEFDGHDQMKQFEIDVINKCMLHGCSAYCLRPEKSQNSSDSNEPPTLKCRFHFGSFDRKEKVSSGKDINLNPTITDGVNPRYEGPRDHPRLVQHVAVRPVSWLAN